MNSLIRRTLATVFISASLATAAPAQAMSLDFGSLGGGQTTGYSGIQIATETANDETPKSSTVDQDIAAKPAAEAPATAETRIDEPVQVTAEAPAQSYMLDALYVATNDFRVQNGLPELTRDLRLEKIAQNWTEKMASVDAISHQRNLPEIYPSAWSWYGENVLQNWKWVTADGLVQQWADSVTHRANMARKDFTHIGIGYVVTEAGKAFSTQNFAAYNN